MGLDQHAIEFLAAARSRGVSFRTCATMGHQSIVISRRALAAAYTVAGCDEPGLAGGRVVRGWLDPILSDFGADEILSIDASDYEGATRVHDLNVPVPVDLHDRFSAVIDVGTLEHVFNFPVAIRNYMRMVAPGGHLLLVTPTNNEAGHGFFQFSPELIFRVLAPRFGFEIESVLLSELGARRPHWYFVADPDTIGARAQFRSAAVTYLFVQARRVGPVPEFEPPPQQSDYSAYWQDRGRPPAERTQLGGLLRSVGSRAPVWKRRYQALFTRRHSLYRRQSYRNLHTHFKRVDGP